MTFIQMGVFIILALAILGGIHYFFYFSLIRFFSIANSFYKNVLMGLISFLAVSFILASLLAHWQENFFTRSFYFVSGFWLGLLTNLILASIIVWLIFGASRTAAIIFFVLAFIFSFYGMWNAFHPVVKNVSVNIPNLPEEWRGKKIVQLSDIHLGIIYKDNFMRSIVEKVNQIQPEMVIITSDLFDGMDGNLDSLVGPLNYIETEKGIFFITGNHETYFGVDKAYTALEKTKVKIMRDEVIDINGLKLIGINYGNVTAIESLKKDFENRPNILFYHSPTNIEQFKNSGVNLQLSGHTHRGQIFPFGLLAKMVYGKFDYGLHKINNFTIYTSSGIGTWGPPMRRPGNYPEIVVITLQ